MIRRDDDDHWLLISQVDHAQVAAEIAAVWGNESIASVPLPERLVPAIRHHDDGWREWGRSPRIDPETGRPRNFTEMPMREATGLWSKSIAVCSGRADKPRQSIETSGRLSPLGGLWVSRHFCWLAERARESRQDGLTGGFARKRPPAFAAGLNANPAAAGTGTARRMVGQSGGIEDCRAIERFLDAQSNLQAELRQQALCDFDGCELEFDSLIENGFRCLQFFDGLSLWLCSAERSEPLDFELPDGQTVRLDPQTPSRIVVTPYPLSVERLELAVEGSRIPIRRYIDDNDLHAALRDARHARLKWLLCPAG